MCRDDSYTWNKCAGTIHTHEHVQGRFIHMYTCRDDSYTGNKCAGTIHTHEHLQGRFIYMNTCRDDSYTWTRAGTIHRHEHVQGRFIHMNTCRDDSYIWSRAGKDEGGGGQVDPVLTQPGHHHLQQAPCRTKTRLTNKQFFFLSFSNFNLIALLRDSNSLLKNF